MDPKELTGSEISDLIMQGENLRGPIVQKLRGLLRTAESEETASLRAEVEHKSLLLHHLCDHIKNPRHAGIWNAQTMEAIDVVNGLRAEVERLKATIKTMTDLDAEIATVAVQRERERDSLRALLRRVEYYVVPEQWSGTDRMTAEQFLDEIASALGAAR